MTSSPPLLHEPGRLLPREIRVSKTDAHPVPEALRVKARTALAEVVERSRVLYSRAFPMPTISFDLRGRVAGKALCSKNHVQLNAQLFIENVETFLSDVIVHEWAHLVTSALYRGSLPHGPQWQSVMRDLGVAPRRCHQMDTTNARVGRQYRYVCGCKSYAFSAIRHSYAQSGRSAYRCRKCRQVLDWADEVGESRTPA